MGGGIGLRSAYRESSQSQGQGEALLGALRMEQPGPGSGRCSGGQAEGRAQPPSAIPPLLVSQ